MNKEKGNTCDGGACGGGPGQDQPLEEILEQKALEDRLSHIRNKIVVLSGKGGVGKSTVAVNIAMSLSLAGKRVGLLDVDFHGPSVPRMLHLEGKRLENDGESILPAQIGELFKVMSIGFLLQNEDDAVIWRGPLKMGAIKQFIKDVAWGDLDYMIIDSPPGTGDEPLSVCQVIGNMTGAVVVTTPQEVSLSDVRKSINFCRRLNLPVIGVIENMSGLACPHCGGMINLFKTGGGEKMAASMGVPFLGRVPIDPLMVESGDDGKPFVYHYSKTETAKSFEKIIEAILDLDKKDAGEDVKKSDGAVKKGDGFMRYALPTARGELCMHFGHCEQFAIVDVEDGEITNTEFAAPPTHEPGVLPRWLSEQKVNVVIAGGMGSRAQDFFRQYGIEVVIGAQPGDPKEVVESYLAGTLQAGANICDH